MCTRFYGNLTNFRAGLLLVPQTGDIFEVCAAYRKLCLIMTRLLCRVLQRVCRSARGYPRGLPGWVSW